MREAELPRRLRRVAGADVSYDRGSPLLFAAVVVLDPATFEVIEIAGVEARARFPYVPGYLSFREIPPLLEAFARLSAPPDLVVCDGQGRAHPRRFGLASHLGILLDLPTIGCAKSRLVGEHREPGPRRGASTQLRHEGGPVERGEPRVLRDRPVEDRDVRVALQDLGVLPDQAEVEQRHELVRVVPADAGQHDGDIVVEEGLMQVGDAVGGRSRHPALVPIGVRHQPHAEAELLEIGGRALDPVRP